jgi:Ala-tRNA(Pro) deacylase
MAPVITNLGTYHRLIRLLDSRGASYRIIDHVEEGKTDAVSVLRGHPLRNAAKCIVVRVGISKRSRRYILSVVPGDRHVDLERVRVLANGKDIGFARPDIAEQLAGSVAGSIIPFSFNSELDLVVDRSLLGCREIFFNAARLDRSIALSCADYLSIAGPRIACIARAADGDDHLAAMNEASEGGAQIERPAGREPFSPDDAA